MHLQLGVPIAAGLETQHVKLMLTRCKCRGINISMTPQIPWCVLGAIDAHEAATAVVSVNTECVVSWTGDREGDPNMEPASAIWAAPECYPASIYYSEFV